jgi:nucleotide-binding universal stress UspA family protein
VARDYLEAVAAKLRGRGVEAKSHVRLGAAGDEILKFSVELQTDLIAMTTHGFTGMKRWMMGSVAERILRSSGVPLLVRKSFEGEVGPPAGPFRKILVPLDGHPEAERVIPFAEALAKAYRAELEVATILHADEAVAAAMAPGSTERYLEEVCGRFRARELAARGVVGHGEPATEIRALIEREKPDLVAMTTHGRTGLHRWLQGSVAETVMRSVTTPIFILRAGGAEEEVGRENFDR